MFNNSFLQRSGRIFLVTTIALLAAGCTRHEVTLASLSFNDALETSSNKQVLLNVVRASLGFPLHFSSLGDFSSNSPLSSAKTKATLPFGRNTTQEFNISPSLGLRSPIKTLAVKNINDMEFGAALLKKIEFPAFDVYLHSSEWRSYLIYSLFVSRLTIRESRKGFIDSHYANICKFADEFEGALCFYIDEIEASCPESAAKIGDHYIFRNNPDSYCEYSLFQAYMWKIITMDPDFKPEDLPDRPGGYTLVFHQRTSTNQIRTVPIDFNTGRSEANVSTGAVLRSPMEIILYVGKLASAQLRAREQYVPKVFTSAGELVPLFEIWTGKSHEATAASVRFRGRSYNVPQTGFDEERQHQSMKVLALISELLAARTARDALRSSTVNLN